MSNRLPDVEVSPEQEARAEQLQHDIMTDADALDAARLIAYQQDRIAELESGEPNWKHPKLQALLSREARLKIELDMVSALIDDPDADLYGLSDYETELTEKLRRLLAELPKPAHEREPPHCKSCACGMPTEPPVDALSKRIGLGWQLSDGHTVTILFASRDDMEAALDQLRGSVTTGDDHAG